MRGLRLLLASAILAGVVLPAYSDDEPQLYRWVDDDGNVFYSDRVPPEYSKLGHYVLNSQGVEVGIVEGEKTAEEIAELARLAAIEEEQRKVREASLLRDRVLLSTYLTVTEIEELRDRRVELRADQIRVTEIYLGNLRQKLMKLQRDAQHYAPYNPNKSAPPIDEKLARELADTLDSILRYDQNLNTSRSEQLQLVVKFESDIDRFRELKRLN